MAVAELNSNITEITQKYSPTLLTGTFNSPTALNTNKIITMPALADWDEIEIKINVGDAVQTPVRFLRILGTQIVIYRGYVSATYSGNLSVTVNWAENKIVLNSSMCSGWSISQIGIAYVVGIIKKQ